MSELAAKKLAEVEAFLIMSGEIIKRASPDLKESAPEVYESLQKASHQSVKAFVDTEMANLFYSKVEKTTKKLTDMMELYVGDSWDNPTEVLEWSSFFSGAGAAHCAIAGGLSKKDGKDEAKKVLDSLQTDFSKTLELVIGSLSNSK